MKTTNPLSKRIRSIRESLGYSQEYVADQMHISQQMYSKIEKNPEKTTLEKLIELARVFRMNVIALLDEDSYALFKKLHSNSSSSGYINALSIVETYNQLIERMESDIFLLKKKMKGDQLEITTQD